MIRVQVSESSLTIPEGEHILTLDAINLVRVPSQYSKEPDGMSDRLKFTFVNENGNTYNVWTNVVYGPRNASLTQFLNTILPDATPAFIKDFDLQELVGRKFKAHIKHTVAPNGKTYPKHLYLIPLQDTGKQKKTTDTEPHDPFADD